MPAQANIDHSDDVLPYADPSRVPVRFGRPGGTGAATALFEEKPTPDDAPPICKLLRERMDAKGVSIRDLARLLPVNKSEVGRWLVGQTRIPEDVLPHVSRALQVDLPSLVAVWEGEEDKELMALPEMPEGLPEALEDMKDAALRDEATERLRHLMKWCRGRMGDSKWNPTHRVQVAKIYLDALKHARGEGGNMGSGMKEVRIYREMGADKLREYIFQRIGYGGEPK